MSPAIATGLTAIVLALLLALRKARAGRERATGDLVLTYGRGLRVFAMIGVGFAAWMTFVGVWGYASSPDHNGWTPGGVVLVSGAMWFIAAPLAIEVFRAWCRFSPTMIVRHSPWRGTLVIHWEDIDSVEYKMASSEYLLRSNRGKIRLHNLLDGIPEFVELARARIPPERWLEKKRVAHP